jgi:AraC-like DNA-binding protein
VVARALGVSTRSLQVQLQEQGTRDSAMLKAARLERAEALLATQSVKATARDLGFTSVAAFSRFFTAAKGRTPLGR